MHRTFLFLLTLSMIAGTVQADGNILQPIIDGARDYSQDRAREKRRDRRDDRNDRRERERRHERRDDRHHRHH